MNLGLYYKYEKNVANDPDVTKKIFYPKPRSRWWLDEGRYTVMI